MRRSYWRHFQNLKNKMIFGEYGRNVHIYPGVRIVRPKFISIGDNVTIGRDTDIYAHPDHPKSKEYIIKVGNNVFIGRNNTIGARNSIVLEEGVGLGPHTMVGDFAHNYEDVEVPFLLQDVSKGGYVRIERNAWIGANVFIVPNVTIGRHAVIGANSVVVRDIPAYSVAVGAPARVIKRYDFNLKKWVRVNG